MNGDLFSFDLMDVTLLAAAVAFGVMGYRQGFVVGTLSFVGFLGGALVGLQLAPIVANRFATSSTRLFVALLVAFGIAVVGQSLALALGSRIRERLKHPQLQTLDSSGGSVVSALTMLLVAWMLAAPLASVPEPWLAAQIRNSRVLSVVDSAMPDGLRKAYSSFSDAVRQQDFPEIFDGLAPSDVPPIASPDPALAQSAVAKQARRSVVKVVGQAPSCDRQLSGTGFVYAPNHILTNAHVVAGTDSVRVELLGRHYSARVVSYDPHRDLAVLYAPGLTAPTISSHGLVAAGADAIVVGFPLDNPYTVVAARVRGRRDLRGPDIYGDQKVTREIYSIRSTVRPGNSGGPLLSPDGSVIGVIFAAAVDDPSTGYALSMREAAPVADAGRSATREVGTQGCD